MDTGYWRVRWFCVQLLLDCSELESRLIEALDLVKTEDYGKDQLATLSFLTKHQVQQTLCPTPPMGSYTLLFLGLRVHLCAAGAGRPAAGAEGGGGALGRAGGKGHPAVEAGGAPPTLQSPQQPESAAAAPGGRQVETRPSACTSGPLARLLTLIWFSARGQRLREVLQLHQFGRESSEMQDWMAQQRQVVESQDVGNNYQHIQVFEHH